MATADASASMDSDLDPDDYESILDSRDGSGDASDPDGVPVDRSEYPAKRPTEDATASDDPSVAHSADPVPRPRDFIITLLALLGIIGGFGLLAWLQRRWSRRR